MRYAWNEAFEKITAAGLLLAARHAAPVTATPYTAGAGSCGAAELTGAAGVGRLAPKKA